MCVLSLYRPSSHIRSPEKVTLVQNCSSLPMWLYVLVETEKRLKGPFTQRYINLIFWLFFSHKTQKEMLLQLKWEHMMTKIPKVVYTTRALYSKSSEAIWLLCVRNRPAERIKICIFNYYSFLLLCMGWTNFHLSPFRQFGLQPMPLYFLTGNLPPKGLTFQEFELIGNS